LRYAASPRGSLQVREVGTSVSGGAVCSRRSPFSMVTPNQEFAKTTGRDAMKNIPEK